jgi:hypothetical protein
MIVVDEVHEALIDPLMIRHVCQRRVDAHTFIDDLGKRAPQFDEPVIGLAGADLISRQDAIFQSVVERASLDADFVWRKGLSMHGNLLASAKDCAIIWHGAANTTKPKHREGPMSRRQGVVNCASS